MILQPENSSLCGQCCLATILGTTLEHAILLIGHSHGTYPKELAKHFKCDTVVLTRGIPSKYSLCKVHFETKKQTHWVLFKDFKVYDPCAGQWLPVEVWEECFAHVIPRITSYIEIKE